MLAFYIDETLTAAEEADAVSRLRSQGRTLDRLEYRRIPCVFPAAHESVTNEKMLEVLKGHIRNAGAPTGAQSIFIVPKDGMRWAVLLQEAFYLVTGFYPVMIQQWQRSLVDDNSAVTRRDYLNMIDMHAVMA
jgi:hypothetical protein